VEPAGAPWRVIESHTPEPSPPAPGDGTRELPLGAIGVVIVAAVIAIAAFLLAARSDPAIEVDGATSVGSGPVAEGGTGAADPEPELALVVEVGGAVARPGVYRLAAGSRVGDAIEAAGGFGPRVDVARADRALNLAAPVRDGDEIRVPGRDDPNAGDTAPDPADGSGAGGLVDLNRAAADVLDTLPGVGPATAAKIIAAREEQPFGSIDDLATRKVVGPATLEKLRALVTVGP